MTKLKDIKAKSEMHPDYQVPKRIYDIESPASKSKPKKIAENILKKIARDIDIKDDLTQLKFDKAKKTILGTQVLFQQYHEKKPISSAWIRVDIDKDGRVYNIQNDLVPGKFLRKIDVSMKRKLSAKKKKSSADKKITAKQADEAACFALKSDTHKKFKEVKSELVYWPHNNVPTLAYKLTILSDSNRAGEWQVYVDAITGETLSKIDLLKHIQGIGQVFDPNPVIALNDATLEDNSQIPDSAYREVTLRDLENSGHLDGPYVSTRNTNNRVNKSNLEFIFKRHQRAFKEVMVYFHIDQFQRYLQDLGFDNVLNEQIKVDVDGIPDDNSFYSPVTKSLTFGRGGVDDAEDADIILHEYGHAMLDNMVPGFGPSGESRAMGEAFGDYIAGSFFAELKANRFKPCIGTWDAVSYSGDNPPNLRRLDSNKKYPRDMVGEEHSDGEIWSACLWQIHSKIGGRNADKLIIAHAFQLPNPWATFEEAANALITTDEVLNQGQNINAIREVFVERGIFVNTQRKNKRAGAAYKHVN